MNTFPTLLPAGGRLATVDSGGRHCPAEALLYPVQVFAPARVAKPLVSVVGFFQVFVALQYHNSWLVVSMYTNGGVQLPLGPPAPAVVVVCVAPLI